MLFFDSIFNLVRIPLLYPDRGRDVRAVLARDRLHTACGLAAQKSEFGAIPTPTLAEF